MDESLECREEAKAFVAQCFTRETLSGELMCQFQDVPRR